MTKTSLLIQEPPLQILPSLAELIGLNEAIVVQQLHFLLQNPKNGREINGHRWIYNTIKEWREKCFPFWSEATIERIFLWLQEKHIIEACQPEGRTSRRKYYRLNLGTFEHLTVEDLAEHRKLRRSGKKQPEGSNLMPSARQQLDAFDDSSLQPSFITETTSETTPETTDVFDLDQNGEPILEDLPQTPPLTTPPRKPKSKKPSPKTMKRPTQQEVEEYSVSLDLPRSDGTYMWLKWEGDEWKHGQGMKKPLINWKTKLQQWKIGGYLPSQKEKSNQRNGTGTGPDGRPTPRMVL